jgi:hypothetical protein
LFGKHQTSYQPLNEEIAASTVLSTHPLSFIKIRGEANLINVIKLLPATLLKLEIKLKDERILPASF